MRFITTFFLTVVFLTSALYGLIMAVDPYNKFGYNLFGFETKAVDFARVNKFNQVEFSKKEYTGFITGSSSAHRYETAALKRLTGLEFYNYSTQSATPEDYLAMTRHFLKRNKHLKMVILSMDYEVLNKNVKTDEMFYASPLKNYLNEVPEDEKKIDLFNNSYFTLAAIQDSFKVIWVNLFGEARHSYLADGNYKRETPDAKELKIIQFNGGAYELSEKRVEYLKTIKAICDEHGIKLIVFTSPISYGHLELVRSTPAAARGQNIFKKALLDTFGEFYDFQNEGIKKYNSLEFFGNSNHPSHDFSNAVMGRIFGQPDPANPEFGRLIKR